LKALEQDSYRRKTTGMLPEAKVAFIDEVFKCLNSSRSIDPSLLCAFFTVSAKPNFPSSLPTGSAALYLKPYA
jgi:hypothetical protein